MGLRHGMRSLATASVVASLVAINIWNRPSLYVKDFWFARSDDTNNSKVLRNAFAPSPRLSKCFKSRYFSSRCRRDGAPSIATFSVQLGNNPPSCFQPGRGLQVECASRHCYDLHILTTPTNNGTRPFVWEKVVGLLLLLQEGRSPSANQPCDLVFWMDADSAITNMTIQLGKIWKEIPANETEKHMIVSGDTLTLNFGQIFWRNSNETLRILHASWDMNNDGGSRVVPLEENGQMAAMIGGCKPSDSDVAKRACCRAMDRGFADKTFAVKFKAGDLPTVHSVASPWARRVIHWVPKVYMNSYQNDFEPHHFTCHAAGMGRAQKERSLGEKVALSIARNNLTLSSAMEDGNCSKWTNKNAREFSG